MYSSNSKYYVFKKSTNKTIALTYGEKSGICYSNLTKKNTWTTPVSIEKQAREPFSACMDTGYNPHNLPGFPRQYFLYPAGRSFNIFFTYAW